MSKLGIHPFIKYIHVHVYMYVCVCVIMYMFMCVSLCSRLPMVISPWCVCVCECVCVCVCRSVCILVDGMRAGLLLSGGTSWRKALANVLFNTYMYVCTSTLAPPIPTYMYLHYIWFKYL